MKKLILGIFTVLTASALNAQLTIQHDGTGPDVSGTIVDITIDGNDALPLEVHFIVTNTSANNQQWRISRERTDVPADWSDNLCWPPACYPTNNVATYITPHTGTSPAPVVILGTSQTTAATQSLEAELKPQITPGSTADSYALFWYFVTDVQGNKVDSVGVRVFSFVGLDEAIAPTLEMTVSPNPAADHLNVKATGANEANVKVVDILGNIVREEKIQGSKKIDVMDLNSGVYFVILESEGLKPVNKKIVIRH